MEKFFDRWFASMTGGALTASGAGIILALLGCLLLGLAALTTGVFVFKLAALIGSTLWGYCVSAKQIEWEKSNKQ